MPAMQYPETGQPDCIALVICDMVIQDKQSNKKSLIGLFSTILVSELPSTRSFFIFASLTNMLKPELLAFIVRDPEGDPVFRAELQPKEGVEFLEHMVHDVVFQFEGVPFHREGIYVIEVWHGDDRMLGHRRVNVSRKKRRRK